MSEAKKIQISQHEYGAECSEDVDAGLSFSTVVIPKDNSLNASPRVTNNLSLPAPLVKALTPFSRSRTPHRISVTELTQPPQLRALKLRHEHEIVEDVSDRLWALLGTLLHGVLESHAEGIDNAIAEQRLDIQVDGWTVSGKYDLSEFIIENELLTDWKLTSVYSLREDEPVKPEWEAQINCYAYLLSQHGRTVNNAQIVAIGRDWSKMRAKREPDYPQKAVCVKPVNLWGQEKALAYIKERLTLHRQAERGRWPECTADDRWARPDLYALMKKGQKRAVRRFESPELAEKWKSEILGGEKTHFIELRKGESVRCANYCPSAPFCKQWAKLNPTLSDTLKESIKVAQQRKGAAA